MVLGATSGGGYSSTSDMLLCYLKHEVSIYGFRVLVGISDAASIDQLGEANV